MIIGQINRLRIDRMTSPGAYLTDTDGNDVLLPSKYIPPRSKIGNNIEVFIYRDSEDRVIATTLTPFIKLNEFGFLKVKDVTKFGAFLDWGIEKDLLVPFREQIGKMVQGKSYLVYLYLDEQTQRLVATQKIKSYLEKEKVLLEEGAEVNLLIGETTELGTKVIIENKYEGLLFKNEVFEDLLIGDRVKGYVKKIREDKKIDVSLQKTGLENLEAGAQKIMDLLDEEDGFVNLSDKSSPEEIQFMLQMSKKNFKRSLGILYKKRLVLIENSGIRKL
ncbi:MAG: S1-like domain-containing RNA-binding protein [Bacteroidota bacterium]